MAQPQLFLTTSHKDGTTLMMVTRFFDWLWFHTRSNLHDHINLSETAKSNLQVNWSRCTRSIRYLREVKTKKARAILTV